ncbi:MAG: AI-2E family transporter [Mesorhizobium sp.]|nr:AI-2E family transporter [Mesorhizobium sp.]
MAEMASGQHWKRTDIILLVALLGVVVWITGDVLLLVFAGILLAVGLDGLAAALARYTPLSRIWALVVVCTVLAVLMPVIVWSVLPQLLGQLDDLWERMTVFVGQFLEMLERSEWASSLMSDSQDQGQMADAAGAAVQQAAWAGLAVIGAVGSVIVLLAIAIFGAAHPSLYRNGLLALFPAAQRPKMAGALTETARALRWWFLGQLVSMLLLGASVSLGLMIIGVDLWLSLGVLTAVLTFIPYLGPIIAGIPIVIIGFAEGYQTGLIVLVFYLVIQNVEGNFLVPMIQQKAVDLAPALLIAAQVLMGTLFGALGLIMAAPLTVVAMVMVRKLYMDGRAEEAYPDP